MYSKTEAAYRILSASPKPLHLKKIIEIATAKGMIVTSGRTPAATLSVDILLENRRRAERGEDARFLKFAPATWGLKKHLKKA